MTAAGVRARRLPPGLSFWDPISLVSTWFGAGLLPGAPGTWGSLAALPVGWAVIDHAGRGWLAAAALGLFVLGWWATDAFVRHAAVQDPGSIVVDEVAAQLLVLTAAPLAPVWFAVAFVLFRIADIWKPWPVSWADRRLHGGFGVMADDLLAAIYAAAALGVAVHFTGAWP
ncbi:MAG: phosphatidylglycerophosphatase A [Rhodospirillales bacterium]